MSTAVATRTSTKVSRPLKILIPLIKQDLEHGDRAGMEYYADAGEKLLEAKAQVAHGYWGTWMSKNFELTNRTAQYYMRLAQVRQDPQKRNGDSELPRSLNEMLGATKRAAETAGQRTTLSFRAPGTRYRFLYPGKTNPR